MTNPATTVTCPHCGASNVAGGKFCESCGKALPDLMPSGPRIVSADALPQTAVGHAMVREELVKTQKKASTALLAVAILQCIGAGIVYLIFQNAPRAQRPPNLELIMAIQGALVLIFFALWAWSLKSPLPASIVGLCLYATLIILNVINAISSGARRGPGVGILDIIIVVVFIQAISASLKHRRLLQQQEGGGGM
jgi:hypothetical protein